MINSKRIEYLLYILSNNKSYVRSSDLAKETGVSVRTIKSEMANVNELAISFGAHIESVKSKGYILVADNQNLFIHKMKRLEQDYRNGTKKTLYKDSEILDLARMILSGSSFSSVEQMASELYLSKNSVSHKLQKLETKLNDFFLHIEKNKKTGCFDIVGKEYNIRTFMLYLSENISTDHFFYTKWFENKKIHKELRNILLNILIEEDFHILDATTRKLEYFIVVSQNRYQANYFLDLDKSKIKDIHSVEAYKIAYKISDECKKKFNYEFDDEEISAIGLFLLLNLDVNAAEGYMKNCSFLNEDAKKIQSYLTRNYLVGENFNLSVFKSILFPILASNYFEAAQTILDVSLSVGPITLMSSPYSVFMAKELLDLIQEKFAYKIMPQNVYTVANQILLTIISIPYTYRPIKLAVCSISGMASANVLSAIIKRRYPELTIIETVELYELRNRKEEDFDVVISDFSGFIYRYNWEHIPVNTIPTKKQLDMIYNSLILNAIDLEQIVKEIGWEKITTYDHFNFNDENEFANLIAYKLGTDEKNIDKIKKSILSSVPYCTENGIAIFYVREELSKEKVFEIYHLKNSKKINDKKIENLIVMTKTDGSIYARFINDLSFALMNNPELVKKIFKEKTIQSLCQTTKEALKSLPINLFKDCTN